jgi:CPA2 family monovalent cation:H+ antiporter-2
MNKEIVYSPRSGEGAVTDIKILTDLLVIFAISIGIVFVFHKFRLPPIARFLAAGILIEPHGLNLASELQSIHCHRRGA